MGDVINMVDHKEKKEELEELTAISNILQKFEAKGFFDTKRIEQNHTLIEKEDLNPFVCKLTITNYNSKLVVETIIKNPFLFLRHSQMLFASSTTKKTKDNLMIEMRKLIQDQSITNLPNIIMKNEVK